MLKNYLDFFNEHRSVLLGGKLTVYNPECGYSMAESEKDNEKITVCYSKNVVILRNGTHYIVNGTGDKEIIVKASGIMKYTIKDCMGNVIESGTKEIVGITEFYVPESGFLITNT